MSANSVGEKKNRALLLVNLGTPDDPSPESVGRYLRQFLMDPRVIDIPFLVRWFLVNILIVPKRKFASARLYQSIWTERGSPLLFHLHDLERGLRATLSDFGIQVASAMRYGQPSLESVLGKLAEMEEIIVFPLYPQYAESTTRSSLEEVERVAAEIGLRARLKFVAPFFAKKEFIEPSAKMIRATWEVEKPEHLLLSFHGLPVRHLHRTDRSSGGHCTKVENCCALIGEANRDCYRAQCVATARELAKAAGLDSSQYTVSFQSRLGQSKWIEPYTDDTIRALAQRGIKRLAVATPAFVADCLETIEEIGIGGAENFRHHGGEKFIRIPCLNSDPEWVAGVTEMVKHSVQTL